MTNTIQDYFGEVISVYTRQQGIEDGLLMENPSKTFDECDVITTNLWGYIENRCKACSLTEPIELLEAIMKQANYIYRKGKFKGDNDKHFFVLNGNGKSVWFVRNEHNKLTGMLPEDY